MEKSLLHDIKGMLVEYRQRFFAAFLMLLASNCLLVCIPLVFRQAVKAMDLKSIPFISLPLWAFMLIGLSFAAAFFKFYMRILFIGVSRDVEKKMRSKLFERIQNQSQAFFDQHGVGDLMSRLTTDILAYRDVLGPGVLYPLYFLTLVVPAMGALFVLSKPLAILALLPIVVLPVLVFVIQKYTYQMSIKVQKSLGDLSTMTHENYSGIRIVKSYTLEKITLQRFQESCSYLMGLNLRLASLQGMLFPFLTLVTKAVTVLLVMLAGFIILQGWNTLSTADFISFMWIQSFIFFPILMLGWLLPVYLKGRAAYARLLEIYLEPVEVQNTQSSEKVPKQPDIFLNDLSYTYPNATFPVLSNIHLHLPAGSFVGITGPVGSGKTTLFRLLNREYEIPHGMIFIGGNEIHHYSLEALRKEISTVEQIPFLFSKSIAENVRFGRDEVTQDELEVVTHQADLHETVMSFSERYETIVGERGTTLSGGQKQRVAVARVFLGNQSIILLDDVFSAVDAETEKHIYDQMKAKFKGKTVVLITHRVSILEKMDRVVCLVNGTIVEDGSPGQLISQQGHFAALVELQKIMKEC